MTDTLRVLLVEDSEDDAFFIQRALERGNYKLFLERAGTLPALKTALDRQPWDVIICDHRLGGFESGDALKIVRDRRIATPFIIVSGTIDEEVAVASIRAGASDYIMKDRIGRLVPAVERELADAKKTSEKLRVERDLQRTQAELADFFQNAAIGLHWMGPDGVILRANEAELEMLGFRESEYVGHSIHEFYCEKQAAAEMLRKLNSGEPVKNFETTLFARDGSIRHVLISANVFRENGVFIHSRGCTRDITERKAAEEKIEHLAAIVESSDDAIIGATLDGIIETWNGAAARMYGYRAGEILGRKISDLLPHYRLDDWPEIRRRVAAGERVEMPENVRLCKNGGTLSVSSNFSPIRNNVGTVVGVSAIERDMTALNKEAEERIQLINDLTETLARSKTLRGLLPICPSCKSIQDDKGQWHTLESYISANSLAEFRECMCPPCTGRFYGGNGGNDGLAPIKKTRRAGQTNFTQAE